VDKPAAVEWITEERARGVIESDTYRRVWARGGQLVLGGMAAALVCWGAAFWWRAIALPAGTSFDFAGVPRVGDLFSVTVDPVLPTLVAALLALAVIKAGGFASRFVVAGASFAGGMAIAWAVLSTSALVGAVELKDTAARAVAAWAMAAICVAVGIAIAEVLPLSDSARRAQRAKRAVEYRDAIARIRVRLKQRPLGDMTASPYAPQQNRWVLVLWYIVPALASALPFVPYAVASVPEEGRAALLVAGTIAVFLLGVVACCDQVIVAAYETADETRRTAVIANIAIGVLLSGALIWICVVMFTLVWPIPLLALAPLVALFSGLVGIVAPYWWRQRGRGWLATAGIANRTFALQRRGFSQDLVIAAIEKVAALDDDDRTVGSPQTPSERFRSLANQGS
jgi:hypothetical protein